MRIRGNLGRICILGDDAGGFGSHQPPLLGLLLGSADEHQVFTTKNSRCPNFWAIGRQSKINSDHQEVRRSLPSALDGPRASVR